MQFIEFSVKNKTIIMTRPSEIQIIVSKADIIFNSFNSGCSFLRKAGIITIHCDCR